MITYPSEVLDFLYHLQLDQHKPAWLHVSADGGILDRGGHQEHYGFQNSSNTIDDVCPWLVGLVPHHGDRLEMSLVEVDDVTAFQPYLLPLEDDETLVVMLDMSSELVLQRAAQQVINEDSLVRQQRSGTSMPFAERLPRGLGFVLLVRSGDDSFRVFGKAPDWWGLDATKIDVVDLCDAHPMLGAWLDEAEAVWSGGPEVAFSEVWETDNGQALFGSAHLVDDNALLMIRSPGPIYDEMRALLEELHSG